jgi:hypothetical protein
MRSQDHRSALIQQVLNGGQGSANTGVIANRAVFNRHIKIHRTRTFLPLHRYLQRFFC